MPQTIYTTAHASNFTIISNSLICSTLPPVAKAVLQYLISKPKDWRLNKKDIKQTLGISAYAVQKAVSILRNLGYLIFERLKTGFGIWNVYDTPQTSVVKPSFEIPTLDNRTVLPNTEVNQKTEHYNAAPAPQQPQKNVVDFAGAGSGTGAIHASAPPIPIPECLKGSQAKAADKLLRNVTPNQAALILMIFNTALASGKIQNPIGYLHSLVKAAQNNTLTSPEPQISTKPITVHDRIAKEQELRKQAERRLKIDNQTFFEKMRQQYGDKFKGQVVTCTQ